MQTLNLHVFPSPLVHDSQQIREVEAVRELGLASRVSVACTWNCELPETEERDQGFTIRRFRLHSDAYGKSALTDALKYLEFIARIFIAYRTEKDLIVNCHSLFVLPVGVLLKTIGSARGLIYDAHELETERNGHGKLLKAVSKVIERAMIRFVDETTVVSPSIANWYRREYPGISVHVLRNVTRRRDLVGNSRIFRDQFKIPDQSIVFIYNGVIGRGRGIDLMLDVFSRIECRHHLVIMGFGPEQNAVETAARDHPKIHFHPRVMPEEVVHYTQGADVGLCIIENTCLSYYYCLPNKLFEYIHSGIPVVTSNFPDLSEIVEHFDCGWVIPVNAGALAELLDAMTLELAQTKKKGVDQVRDEIHWDKEKFALREVYRNFLPA